MADDSSHVNVDVNTFKVPLIFSNAADTQKKMWQSYGRKIVFSHFSSALPPLSFRFPFLVPMTHFSPSISYQQNNNKKVLRQKQSLCVWKCRWQTFPQLFVLIKAELNELNIPKNNILFKSTCGVSWCSSFNGEKQCEGRFLTWNQNVYLFSLSPSPHFPVIGAQTQAKLPVNFCFTI